MHVGVCLCAHFTGKEQNARGKAVVQIYVQVQSQACACPFRATGSRGDSSARRVLRGIEYGPPAQKKLVTRTGGTNMTGSLGLSDSLMGMGDRTHTASDKNRKNKYTERGDLQVP